MGKWIDLAALQEQKRTRKQTQALVAAQRFGGGHDAARIAQLEARVASLEARMQWAIEHIQAKNS